MSMNELSGELAVAEVAEVERVALRAWPALEILPQHGWLLRFAFGVTRRANSVWPNKGELTMELADAVGQVEAFYQAHALPARFQICPAAQPEGLDSWLAQRGYRAAARTAVQTARLDEVIESLYRRADGNVARMAIEVLPQPSGAWWACYAAADEVPLESVKVRQQICSAIRNPCAYVSVSLDGEAAAVGSAVVQDGWVGFFNIATLTGWRRRGAARAVMLALAEWARSQGATRAYLQVMAENLAAIQLYHQLGFRTGYYYHYREAARS